MDIPIPFNFVSKVASWVWERVTRGLLYETYARSHERWSSNHRLGSHWDALGDHLEYSVNLAQPTYPESRVGKLALRATGEAVAGVELFFEARGLGIKYQQRISLCNVDDTPMICNLTNIPMMQYVASPGDCISFTVEDFRFLQCEVKLSSGEKVRAFDSVRSYLTHSWLLSDDWSYRWGYWWNCNSIKFAKHELSTYWRWGFGLPRVRVYTPRTTSPYRKSLMQALLQGFGWLMGSAPLVTVQFWFAIWSGLFVMDKDDRLCWRWSTKQNGDAEG